MFLSVALWNILFCNALSHESNRSVYIKRLKVCQRLFWEGF